MYFDQVASRLPEHEYATCTYDTVFLNLNQELDNLMIEMLLI